MSLFERICRDALGQVVLCLFLLTGIACHGTAQAFECTAVAGTNDGTAPEDNDTDLNTACGEGAAASGTTSTALGEGATATASNGTAVGSGAEAAGGINTTAVGASANAGGTDGTALGHNANAGGGSSTSLGKSSTAGTRGTAVGTNASAFMAASGTAVGQAASAGAENTIAIGADGDTSGTGAEANQADNIAIGVDSLASGTLGSIAIGKSAVASGDQSTALGMGAKATQPRSIAIGRSAEAVGTDGLVVGVSSFARNGGIAIGKDAGTTSTKGNLSTAVGTGAKTGDDHGTAIGFAATVPFGHTNATALGYRAQAEQSNAMVLGSIPGINSGANYVDIANGTTTPMAALHIKRTDHTLPAQILVEDTSSTTEPRSMFELLNNGPVGFNMENTSTGQRWRFAAQTTGFRISLAGTGGPEFEVLDNGDAVLAGTLTENSDINVKQDIAELEGPMVLAKLEQLPVSEWSYKASPQSRHIGPMAQDFHAAFGLGADEKHISPRDMAGVNMAAIKAQQDQIKAIKARHKQAMDEKDIQIATQQRQINALRLELRQTATALKMRLEALDSANHLVQTSVQ